MLFYIPAVLVFLYYFSAIPVKLALALRVGEHPEFGFGASVFEGHYALNSAFLRAMRLKKQRSLKKDDLKLPNSALLSAVVKSARHLLKHSHLEQIRLEGHISSSDAARTALICGYVRALEGALIPCTPPGTILLRLNPDFNSGASDILFNGMVSVRAGHIMLAALVGAWNFITRSIAHGKASD